jgi:hypothetical protein
VKSSDQSAHKNRTIRKGNGNAKHRTRGLSPAINAKRIEIATRTRAIPQLIKRQSGFASATNRSGKNRNAQMTAVFPAKRITALAFDQRRSQLTQEQLARLNF